MKSNARKVIYCCRCNCEVEARLTKGREVYPHRKDLAWQPFWRCDACGNWVGCHHKTKNPTRPLGVIPTPELKRARRHIHELLDTLWNSRQERKNVYEQLSNMLGWKYHTADIKTIKEARKVYRFLNKYKRELSERTNEIKNHLSKES